MTDPDRAHREARRRPSDVVGDVVGSCLWGLGLALVLSVFVVLVRGASMFGEGGGGVKGLLAVVLSYLVAGLVGGAVVGVLKPLGRSVVGSALLGFLASMPVFLAFQYFDQGPAVWSTGRLIDMVLFACVLGAPLGVIYRRLLGNWP